LVKENFREGSFVKEGQILYEIQKDEYRAVLNEAKASLLKSEANYNKALKDWSRAEFLFKNSAMSEQQKDEFFYAKESTQAEMQKAKAAVVNAELNYGYTTIKAPLSGVIGLSSSDEGSYIEAQNAKLTTITALDKLYAEFSIPSKDLYVQGIKNGAKVTIKMGAKEYEGSVDFIAPKLDPQTDTLLLRAVFANQNRELTVGSYVEVSLGGFSYESVAKIPQNALIKTPDATVVYVIENGGVSMKPVKVVNSKDGIAMIESGVESDAQIAISNIAKLRPNSKVTIMDGK
jgi:membrane fusion protein (multidrug efflux system)